jgi:hypothetical protein
MKKIDNCCIIIIRYRKGVKRKKKEGRKRDKEKTIREERKKQDIKLKYI